MLSRKVRDRRVVGLSTSLILPQEYRCYTSTSLFSGGGAKTIIVKPGEWSTFSYRAGTFGDEACLGNKVG